MTPSLTRLAALMALAATSLTVAAQAAPQYEFRARKPGLQVTPTEQGSTARWGVTALDFSGVMVGSTAVRTATLYNDGPDTASWSALSGLSSGVTASLSGCATVPAAGSCTVTFTYAPTQMGAYSATDVHVATGRYANSLSLSGEGLVTAVDLSATELTFASRVIGTTSTAQSVLITNSGNTSVNIGALTYTGPFSATTSCGATLAAGQTCSVSVTFTPTATGVVSGTVTLQTAVGSQSIALTGTGQNPTLPTMSAGSYEWAYSGTKQSYTDATALCALSINGKAGWSLPTLTEAESLRAAVGLAGLTSAGWAPEYYTSYWTTSPYNGGYWVMYANPAIDGGKSYAYSNNTTVSTLCRRVKANASLSGSGDFGGVYVGSTISRTFTFTNAGTVSLSDVSPSVAGSGFSLSATTCGSTLAASGSCTVTVQFSPGAPVASASGSVKVASTADNGEQSVALSATGLAVTTDPSYANVTLLMNMDGTQGQTVPSDAKNHVFSAGSGAALTTATVKNGSASLNVTGFGGPTTAASADFSTVAGDWTFEGWIRRTGWAQGSNVNAGVLAAVGNMSSSLSWQLAVNKSGALVFTPGTGAVGWGTAAVSTGGVIAADTWTHVAVVRTGTTLKMFANGNQVYSGSPSFGAAPAGWLYLGTYFGCAGGPAANWCDNFVGQLDDVRFTKGVARYTSAFTVPAGPHPSN